MASDARFMETKLPSNRSVGRLFSLVFVVTALILGLPEWNGLASSFLLIAALLFTVAHVRPSFLLPLNRAWMALAQLLNRVVSPIAMGVIFFGMISPIAVLMRIAGRDELRLSSRLLETQWVNRAEQVQCPPGFTRQY